MSDVLVLCYHAVSERWDADLSCTPDQLRRQLELLVRRGYRGTTFTQAVTDRARGRVLAVTFDDAFRSVLELGKPILDSLGLPATVFAVSAFASSGRPLSWPGVTHWADGPHHHELAGLTWAELRGLADHGWEVGSHTRTHPRLTELDGDDLRRELEGSREEAERALGLPCRSVAYPYGDVDRRVVAATAAAGYAAAAALPARLHRADPLEWPRIGVYHPDSLRRFGVKVSPAVRLMRRIVEPPRRRLAR
jgi:peptidoglycan/xylan/chitin deacetylase (PgdA/CDA1 family)